MKKNLIEPKENYSGEMRALINEKDWASTPLGDLETWPQSLRTMVSVILDNPFGMFIAWGPNYIQLYNDAYRSIMGIANQNAALGVGTADTFPKTWYLTEPLFDRVMQGQSVEYLDYMLSIEKNGSTENCYFNFSYSPIRLVNGEVGGILVTAIENTPKTVSEQAPDKSKNQKQVTGKSALSNIENYLKLASPDNNFQNLKSETEKLQRLYEALTDSSPDLMYIFDLNYCFTYANRALLAMWGKTYEAAIGHNLRENGYALWHASLHEREIDEVIRTKKTIRGTVAFNHAELGRRIYDYIFTPVTNEQGTVEAVAGTGRDITEIRNTEDNLHKSEQQMRTMVQTAPIPIGVYIGEEMKIQFANQSILDIWGKGPDVIGKSFKQILPELDNQDVFDQLASVYDTGVACHIKNQRIEIITEGKIQSFYFDYSFTPLFDTEGKIYGIINTGADVTDLNLAKLAIQKSEEFLRNTILQAPVAMCIFKGENFIVDLANDRMFELWGKSEQSVFNKPIFTGLPEAKDQGFEAILEGVYSSGKSFSADGIPVTLPRNGGIQVVYLNLVFEPFKDSNGIISGILGVAIDVTVQLTAHKKIEEREQKFRALSETIPHMIWTSTPDLRKNYFNQTFLDYTGLAFADLEGEGWKQIVFPDDLAKELTLWNQSLAKGADWTMEKRLRQHDGNYRWFLCQFIAQKDLSGNVIGWIGTNTLIQEQKMKEQQMDEFISLASHEMKTPLTSAKGYIELLLHSLNTEELPGLFARKALQAVERLNDLVVELLDAGKLKNGQLIYNFTTFDFDGLLNETIANMQLTAKNHRLKKIGTSNSQITGDKERLQQVLINILSNAIKYSPQGDQVIITIEEHRGSIQVAVRDFGIGIPRNHLEKVFDRYYRVQEHSILFQGLGIGLFISSSIIQKHGGKMWVESEPHKGSTFYFNLPI